MESEAKNFPIERLLSDMDKVKLYEMMRTPGWKVLIQLLDNIQVDWAEQVMSRDYTGSDQGVIIQDLLRKQGQRDGLVRFFRALQMWKKSRDRDLADGVN